MTLAETLTVVSVYVSIFAMLFTNIWTARKLGGITSHALNQVKELLDLIEKHREVIANQRALVDQANEAAEHALAIAEFAKNRYFEMLHCLARGHL